MEDFIPNRSLKSVIEEMQNRAISQVSSVCSSTVTQNTQANALNNTTRIPKEDRKKNSYFLDDPQFVRMGEVYKEVEIRAREARQNDWADSIESKKLCETVFTAT